MKLENFVKANSIEKFYVTNSNRSRTNLVTTKNWEDFSSYDYWKDCEVISAEKGFSFITGTNGYLIIVK